jgi:hypothetical protein
MDKITEHLDLKPLGEGVPDKLGQRSVKVHGPVPASPSAGGPVGNSAQASGSTDSALGDTGGASGEGCPQVVRVVSKRRWLARTRSSGAYRWEDVVTLLRTPHAPAGHCCGQLGVPTIDVAG